MDEIILCKGKEGLFPLLGEENFSFLDFFILRLKERGVFERREKNKETVLVLLSGEGILKVKERKWKVKRKDVFSQRATGLFIPPRCPYRIEAKTTMEVAVALSPSQKLGEPYFVSPGEVRVEVRGRGSFRRKVYSIIGEKIPAERLLVGETQNFPGKWSSFPPHKHDKDSPPEEIRLEEVYFFKIHPPQGFGLCRIYTEEKDIDRAYVIKNNSCLLIPRGYHPLCASPGYKLWYLWVLAGEERKFSPREDPWHSWIK